MENSNNTKVDNPIMIAAIGERTDGTRVAMPELYKVRASIYPDSMPDVKQKAILSEKPKEIATGYNWANWGDRDSLPNEWEDKIKENPTAAQAILKNMMSLMSDGIVYCESSQMRKHPSLREETYSDEVETFLEQNSIVKQMMLVGSQFFTYAQYFISYTLTNDRTKIGFAQVLPCPYTRKTKQDPKTLNSDFLLFSEKFGNRWGFPRKEEIVPVPLMNDFQYDFFEKLKGYRFARHIALPLTSYFYYASPPWSGLFKPNGWIDIASKVPNLVGSMQDNQLRVVYMIKISEDYFRFRYVDQNDPAKNWDQMTLEAKNAVIAEKFSSIENALTGVQNAGKTISYLYEQDPNNPSLKRGLIEIEAIDNKIKSGDWLPDISQADSQIVLGMGVSGSMYGLQNQGGKMGAGSGSDKMQDRNIAISTNTMMQAMVLDWLNYISRFNKWGVTFYFRDLMLTTKDQSAGGFEPPVQS
jgi:hypothetical protein